MVSLVLYSAVFLLMLTPLPFVQHLFARVVEALVHVQNEVLRWIEHLPGAAVDDIWLDIWGVLLVYLFLGMAYYGFLRLTVRRVCFALLALLAVVSWHSLSIMSNAPRQGIAFYSVRGCPVVHCMADNRHSWLACADSLPDMPRLCRALLRIGAACIWRLPDWLPEIIQLPAYPCATRLSLTPVSASVFFPTTVGETRTLPVPFQLIICMSPRGIKVG